MADEHDAPAELPDVPRAHHPDVPRAHHPDVPRAHHPRAEAHAMLHGRYTVRVLEPSPPAIGAPPHYADDPVARAADNERLVVTPVATGDRSWSQILAERDDAALTAWAQDRWLGAWRELAPQPDSYTRTVAEHAALAARVLGPWRSRRTAGADDGLRATFRGLGTPFCWDDQQLRLETGLLVLQRGGEVVSLRPDDLEEAALLAGTPIAARGTPTPADALAAAIGPREPLVLDPVGSLALADRLMAATLVLERVRLRTGTRSRVRLDPIRFELTLVLDRHTARMTPATTSYHLDAEVCVTDADLVGDADHLDVAEAAIIDRLGGAVAR
jgi:hypothetical protein